MKKIYLIFICILPNLIFSQTINYCDFFYCEIYSQESDSQYLGNTNPNEFNGESILNDFGDYGSQFSSTSINNQFSDYGSQFGTYSAYNSLAQKPPILYKFNCYNQKNEIVGYLTKNEVLNTGTYPKVDPDSLIYALENKNCYSNNHLPSIISTPDTVALEDQVYNYLIQTNDIDDDLLVIYSLILPDWLVLEDFGNGTALINGTPTNYDVEDWNRVTIYVCDGEYINYQSFEIDIIETNDSPQFLSNPLTTANEDSEYKYTIYTNDQEKDSVYLSVNNIPKWLEFKDNKDGTAILSGIPTNNDIGKYTINIIASDGKDSISQEFILEVINVNDVPEFTSIPLLEAYVDSTYFYSITTADADSNSVTITAPTRPEWLSMVDNGDGTATLTGIPESTDIGYHNILIRVNDGIIFSDQDFIISVFSSGTNIKPSFTSIPETKGTTNILYEYHVSSKDDDNDELTLKTNSLPEWLSFVDNGNGTGLLTGQPTENEIGSHSIRVTVSDGRDSSYQAFAINVKENVAPLIISDASTEAIINTEYTYNIEADDSNGNTIIISAPVIPIWLSFVDNGNGTAILKGTPTSNHIGDNLIQIRATDGDLSANQDFTINVINPTFTSNHSVEDLNIYPNPFSSNINIISENIIQQVRIYNLHGELLIVQRINAKQVVLDGSHLPKGFYLFSVQFKENTLIKKLIKK